VRDGGLSWESWGASLQGEPTGMPLGERGARMTLERKDVRPKFDFEMHQALKVLAEVDGLTLEKWCERAVCRAIRERIHYASLIAETAGRLKISGIGRAEPSGFGDLR
jgi:hypothetical protein